MRPRTFILLILVLLIGGATIALWVLNNADTGGVVDRTGGGDTAVGSQPAAEPGLPPPTPTPAVRLAPVVVARVDIPVGQRLTEEVLEVRFRPDDNKALIGGYVYSEVSELVGQIAGASIAEGQAILRPMIALNSTDIDSFGSDLALYIDQGKVAVAFPLILPGEDDLNLAALRGAAFAMRPGDLVDVMMTLRIVEIDPEFRTALPNMTQRVYQAGLLAGSEFLFPPTVQGRLEFIPAINQVAEIVPMANYIPGQDFAPGAPIPKRVTQLTIQQAEVIWVGTWRDQGQLIAALQPTPAPVVDGGAQTDAVPVEQATPTAKGSVCISPFTNEVIPCPIVRESGRPDVVILSMSSQDALALKWALERGVDIDLALRAQGDRLTFVTTSVSLPQIVNEGGLAVPPESDFDLHPRLEDVVIPILSDEAPAE